jgi:hypothetical protein
MTLKYLLSALAHECVDAAGLGLPLRQAKRAAAYIPQGILDCPLGGLRRQLIGVGAPADVADPAMRCLNALGLALTKKIHLFRTNALPANIFIAAEPCFGPLFDLPILRTIVQAA